MELSEEIEEVERAREDNERIQSQLNLRHGDDDDDDDDDGYDDRGRRRTGIAQTDFDMYVFKELRVVLEPSGVQNFAR